MRKTHLSILILLLSASSFMELHAQNYNRKMTNNKTGEEILVGLCTRQALSKNKNKDWFDPEYRSYKINADKQLLDSLKMYISGVEIKIVMGTWCRDSQEQVPRFFSILDYLKVKEGSYSIICVNTEKEAVAFSIEELDIILVPTIIFLRKGEEIGRIIETPIISLEQDMLNILKKQP